MIKPLIPQSTAKVYKIYGASNFNGFVASNWCNLFPSVSNPEARETGDLLILKDQMELFKKAWKNTVGGCPCNAASRRERAVKMYVEAVVVLSKCQPHVKEVCFKNLGGVDRVEFYKESPDQVAQIVIKDPSKLVPFITLEKL